MNTWKKSLCLALLFNVLGIVYEQRRQSTKMDSSLAEKIRRFAPTPLTADTSRLAVSDRKALQTIIAATNYFDPLYRRQIWSGNEPLFKRLQADKSILGRERLHYFLINAGPWSQLDANEPFIDGVPPRPAQANFYPDDLTKEEFN